MNLRFAKKLHEGDEVTVKETKEIVKVHSVVTEANNVTIEVFTKDGWRKFTHKEVQ